MSRKTIFDAIQRERDGKPWQPAEVALVDGLLTRLGIPKDGDAMPLTVRSLAELVGHEAIVQEWYLDSVGVGTWGVGVTKAAGIDVALFKDNPQSITQCLEAFINLVRMKYGKAVLEAFGDRALSEAQFAAALSFHYNTGSINTASWVKLWLAGSIEAARASFLSWRIPAAIMERRQKECDLFFDGEWSGDGTALVVPVSKPAYKPAFSKAKRVDIRPNLAAALGVSL